MEHAILERTIEAILCKDSFLESLAMETGGKSTNAGFALGSGQPHGKKTNAYIWTVSWSEE